MTARVSIVVPSLGLSPDLDELVARLREELAAVRGELLWVHQGDARAAPRLDRVGERVVPFSPSRPSFAGAVERGLRAATAPVVGLLNDDAVPEPGWLAALLAALEGDPELVAVQGVQTVAGRPEACDGCGLEWSRRWEAAQIGHGAAPPARDRPPFEVYGVSATAALYRRAALDAAALPSGRLLEGRLGSWYEDVELADRLRARAGRSLCVPAARVRHRGSATGERRPFHRHRLLARNRWLVTARLLGRRWPAIWPALLAVDLRETARRLGRAELRVASGRIAGPASAVRLLPHFLRAGPPLVEPGEIARLRIGSPP